jgi:hypothetical protein
MVLCAKSGGQRPPVSTQQRTAKGPVNLERVTRDCKCGGSQTSAIHCLSLPRGDGSFLSRPLPVAKLSSTTPVGSWRMYSDTSAKLGSKVSRLGGFGDGPLAAGGSLETRKGSAEIQGLEVAVLCLVIFHRAQLRLVPNGGRGRLSLARSAPIAARPLLLQLGAHLHGSPCAHPPPLCTSLLAEIPLSLPWQPSGRAHPCPSPWSRHPPLSFFSVELASAPDSCSLNLQPRCCLAARQRLLCPCPSMAMSPTAASSARSLPPSSTSSPRWLGASTVAPNSPCALPSAARSFHVVRRASLLAMVARSARPWSCPAPLLVGRILCVCTHGRAAPMARYLNLHTR